MKSKTLGKRGGKKSKFSIYILFLYTNPMGNTIVNARKLVVYTIHVVPGPAHGTYSLMGRWKNKSTINQRSYML